MGPIALLSNFKLTKSSGKHLQDISHAHVVSLLYKLITSSKDSEDLSIDFDRSRNRRRDKLTTNKNVKGKYHLRILLKCFFGFSECQEKAIDGLGYRQTLSRSKGDNVIDKAVGIADARIEIDHIHWFVPHFTPSIQQQATSFNQFLTKTPTELRYVERSVFMKKVNNQNL